MCLLLQPLQVGQMILKNRLVMPPMATAKADADGKVSQAIIDYYREKTNGGYIALVIVEHSYVAPSGKLSSNQMSIAEDSMIAPLKTLVDTIHQNGSLAVIQITHAGSVTKKEIIGTTPVAPSAVANPKNGTFPRELAYSEIQDIIDDFKNAALRAKAAGFDGVELHAAHGFLLNQFFSPLSNKRTDEYGGTIYNRLRIHLQIIKAIRSAAGENFPILVRLGASDFKDGGITIEDSLIAAHEFEKAGICILDVSGGFAGANVPGLTGQGYFAPLTEAIKKAVSVPVILTGGITEVQAAEQFLSEGKADLIGVGRAILHNSEWAKQAIESLK